MSKRLPKKYILLFALSAFAFNLSYGQQDAQYSLYFFNPLLINPAYSASADGLKLIAIGRNQWVNFDGAPKTAAVSAYGPVANKNIGLGVNLNYDQLGATRSTSGFLNFSYQLKFKSKKRGTGSRSGGLYSIKNSSSRKSRRRDMNYLSFGVNAGFDMYQTRFAGLRVGDNSDPIYTEGYDYSQILSNIGAGIYYYNSRHFFGISVPKLSKNQLNSPAQTATQERHMYVFGGFVRETNSNVSIRPSFILKAVANAPVSIDFNLSFLFNERIWVGGMYRHKSAIGFNTMFIITNAFKLGYAYDYSLNAIQRYSTGSHEVMLSYEFLNKKKIRVASCSAPKF